MNDKELEAAKCVVNTSRKMSDKGFVVGSCGNASMRVEEKFVITPSGINYDKMKPEDMVVVGINGEIIEGKWKPSTETPLHAAIYNKRKDVGGILHTHSVFASSVAVTRGVIPPIIEDLVQIVGGKVDVAPYALAGTEKLKQNVLKALSDKKAALLANHGMVAVGKNLEEVWTVCKIVEKSARILVYSQMLGKPVILGSEEVKKLKNLFQTQYGQK